MIEDTEHNDLEIVTKKKQNIYQRTDHSKYQIHKQLHPGEEKDTKYLIYHSQMSQYQFGKNARFITKELTQTVPGLEFFQV